MYLNKEKMMSEKKLTRKEFLKFAGMAGLSLPAVNVVGRIGNDYLLSSPEEYGGFLIRKASNPPYQVDDSIYKRFNQKYTLFSRSYWDEGIRTSEAPYASVAMERMAANEDGFTRLDYAFYRASWTVHRALNTTTGNGEGGAGLYNWETLGAVAPYDTLPPWEPTDMTPEEVSTAIKIAAKFYGASLAGIAEVDERWIYEKVFNRYSEPLGLEKEIVFDDVDAPVYSADGPCIIPSSYKYVISLAFEMDYDGMTTYIGGPGSAATGNGYSRMGFTASCLAEFIRALGYGAIPSGNCTGLSIPIAVDAGLGELGRMGLLVTPKYGPRVRLAKVFTNLPLVPDGPISFGVDEFCQVCGKCATDCPNQAISAGDKTYEAVNVSTNPGVLKWPINAELCHLTWAQQGMDCSKCIQVCPFNKPQGWLHEATHILIGANSGTIDKLLLNLDDASQYGDRAAPSEFWKTKINKDFVHTKGA